jgi:hypothetical protein
VGKNEVGALYVACTWESVLVCRFVTERFCLGRTRSGTSTVIQVLVGGGCVCRRQRGGGRYMPIGWWFIIYVLGWKCILVVITHTIYW